MTKQYEHHIANYLYVKPVESSLPGLMTPTPHEKSEWARMAQAAYAADHNAVGHRYSGAASIRDGQRIPSEEFDNLQAGYRSWLCFNDFKAAEYWVQKPPYIAHHTGSFA